MYWIAVPVFLALFLAIWGYASSGILLKTERLPLDLTPKSFGLSFESFTAWTEDGVGLDCWFVPAKKKSRAAVVLLHGWGANKSDVLDQTVPLAEEYNLVYFDFRNHGASGGDRTSLTCLEVRDFQAVVKYLKKEKGASCQHLGAWGFSMGGSAALSGAAGLRSMVDAVVAESPFSSYNGTVARFAKVFYGAPGFLVPFTLWFSRMRLGFDPEECSPIHHVSRISPRPVFIIQGDSDLRMPVEEGRALFDKAGEPKEIWVVPGSDHIGARDLFREEYDRRILSFFRQWIKT